MSNPNIDKLPFVLEGKIFHKLNQISSPKEYIIQVGKIQYSFSQLQIALISLNALFHFDQTNEPFHLLPSQNIQLSDLNSAFISLISLFKDQTELVINEDNINVMTALAEILDTPLLLLKCYNFTSSSPQSFTFSSNNLLFIPQIKRSLLNDFKFILNNQIFEVNYSLICCCSDKMIKMNSHQSEMICQIPNEHLNCFCSFMNLFKGKPFYFQDYSLNSLSYLIEFFGLSCLFHSLSSSFSKPTTVIDSIKFLSISNCEYFDDYFNANLLFLIQNIESISIENLNRFPNSILEKIFLSTNL
jgi:hypothetical protein